MGRKAAGVASEAKVVSGAKGKGVGGGAAVKGKEAVKVAKKVSIVKGGQDQVVGSKGGVAGGEGEAVVKKGGWRIRRGGVPVSSTWSSRQWATVGVLSNVSVEKPWITMRDLRKWWKTYVPGEWRSEYGILTKELDGLSKLKFVRLSRSGGRVRATKKSLSMLYGSGGV